MGGHRTIFFLVAIMTAVILVIGGVAIGVPYDTAFEQRRAEPMRRALTGESGAAIGPRLCVPTVEFVRCN